MLKMNIDEDLTPYTTLFKVAEVCTTNIQNLLDAYMRSLTVARCLRIIILKKWYTFHKSGQFKEERRANANLVHGPVIHDA